MTDVFEALQSRIEKDLAVASQVSIKGIVDEDGTTLTILRKSGATVTYKNIITYVEYECHLYWTVYRSILNVEGECIDREHFWLEYDGAEYNDQVEYIELLLHLGGKE